MNILLRDNRVNRLNPACVGSPKDQSLSVFNRLGAVRRSIKVSVING